MSGIAADWLEAQNPDPADAIDLFEKLKEMGKSPLGTLVAKSVQASDWNSLVSVVEDNHTKWLSKQQPPDPDGIPPDEHVEEALP